MEKAFKAMGYATQVKALSDFHEDYGLPGGDDDPDEDEEESDSGDDDDDMSEGSDDDSA